MNIGEDIIRISELPVADRVLSGDIFMFSMNPTGHVHISSHGSTASDITNDIMNEFLCQISVGSMAYQSKYDYAKVNHDHDFSRTFVRTYETGGTKIGTVYVSADGWQICSDVKKNDYVFPEEPIPRIGSVRLIHAPTKPKDSILLDMQNGTFDGWTYPDGGSYGRYVGEYDFSEAYGHFGGSGDSFYVPLLSGFFRLITGEYVPCAHFQQQVGIMDHMHMVQDTKVKLDFSESIGAYCYVTDKNGTLSSNAVCRSDGKSGQSDKNGQITLTNKVITMNLRNDITIGNETVGETYPSHNIVPCMIYIGKTKTEVGQ